MTKLSNHDLMQLGHNVLREMSNRLVAETVKDGCDKNESAHEHPLEGTDISPEVLSYFKIGTKESSQEASMDQNEPKAMTLEEFTGGAETPPEVIEAFLHGDILGTIKFV